MSTYFEVYTKKQRKEYNRQWYICNKSKALENSILRARKNLCKKFDISIPEYNSLLEEQNHKCAICSAPNRSGRGRKLCLDHDHFSGKIRAFLCGKCNRFLGLVSEDVGLLQRMVQYIQEHKSESI